MTIMVKEKGLDGFLNFDNMIQKRAGLYLASLHNILMLRI